MIHVAIDCAKYAYARFQKWSNEPATLSTYLWACLWTILIAFLLMLPFLKGH